MTMKNAVSIFLLFISFYSCARAHQTYGLCSQFYQMYQYCTNSSATPERVATTVVEHKIGKKGPKGDRGSPGEVNFTAINSRIDEGIKTQFNTHESESRKKEEVQNDAIKKINGTLSSLSSSLEKMTNKMQRVCPIFYKNKCFVPVMNKAYTLDEARDICAGMSGKVADIYDMDHFDLIVKQVRANHMNGKSSVDLRLGMTIKPSTGQVSLSDETKVTYLNKWYPDYPSKSSTYTSVNFQVKRSATDVYQYLWNTTPTNKYNILCEI